MKEKEEYYVSQELQDEADKIWEDPEKILSLIDLIFLGKQDKYVS